MLLSLKTVLLSGLYSVCSVSLDDDKKLITKILIKSISFPGSVLKILLLSTIERFKA